MEILRANLSTSSTATGLVVVIDVLRAFTTAAYFFDAGVAEIMLVSGIEEAFRLRDDLPGSLISGEVDGIKVPGFDLGNSPAAVLNENLAGKRIIQRTTAGTQGVVLAAQASTILTAALTNVSATVRYIQKTAAPKVTLIQSGYFPDRGWGDEDVACADTIEGMLTGKPVDPVQVAQRVRASRSGKHFDGTRADFPARDLELALELDTFNFAMLVERRHPLHILRRTAV